MARQHRQTALPGMDDDPVSSAPPTARTAVSGSADVPDGDAALAAACDLAAPPAPEDLIPPNLEGKTVWGIDAMSLIFQVFHAIPEMTSPRGEPVNAVFGFVRDILQLLDKKKPDYLFCAFDLPGPTFRHDLYVEYKAHRAELPADLAPQFGMIRRFLEAFGIPVLCRESFEADDVLATLARITEENGGECFVVTGDKDCRQLITDRIHVYNVRKDQTYDAEALRADWGIRPDQVVDYQCLVGDSVDNIPGIPLIGPKIAGELLQKYDSLESIFEHAHELSGAKRKQNIMEGREKALLSRRLVELDQHVDVPIDWRRGKAGGFNTPALVALCGEFGFHRMADQIRALEGPAPAPAWEANYRVVAAPDEFARLITALRDQPAFALRVITDGREPRQAAILGLALCFQPGEACYVPLRAPEGERALDPSQAFAALRPLLENPSPQKVGQNLKFDVLVLRSAAAIEMHGLGFDTMLASYLLEAGERNHHLGELAQRFLSHAATKLEDLQGAGKERRALADISTARLGPYAAEEADLPWRLRPVLGEKLRAAQLEELLRNVELPLIEVLAEMEFNGIRIDVTRLAELSAKYGERLLALETEIYALAGHEFNIASPKQLQQVLFEELKLPVVTRAKTGPSTDASVLEELAKQHALPAKIIEHRQYAKLQGTYVDALPTLVNPQTGRIHASFHQAVAATGRLSSSDPNLQNIPIRTPQGREIRSAFLPGQDDWILLAADYSQIELRVLAHYCRDDTLCAAFANDEDIHTRVASEVYGVNMAEVTSEMRRAAKAVNFGIIYGQSPFGLAAALGITKEEAAAFIDAYFARYPGVETFLEQVLADARKQGFVTTMLGRRRAISGVREDGGRLRNLPERTAINTVIQGSAADLIKLAMIAIHRRLRQEKLTARMLLQIHDELVFETPEAEAPALATLVTAEMSNVMKLAVPLKVDLKTGHNWAETEPWS